MVHGLCRRQDSATFELLTYRNAFRSTSMYVHFHLKNGQMVTCRDNRTAEVIRLDMSTAMRNATAIAGSYGESRFVIPVDFVAYIEVSTV